MTGLLVLALGFIIMAAVLAAYELASTMDDMRRGRR